MTNEERLSDKEWAELQEGRAALQKAYKADPEGTKQAIKDAIQLPRKSGDLKD